MATTNGHTSASTSAMDVDPPALPAGAQTASNGPPLAHPMTRRAASVPLHMQRFNVGYVYATEMMLHSSEQEHPEKPARIARVHDVFKLNGLVANMKRIPIRLAKREEVLLVHSEQVWEDVAKLKHFSPQDIINSQDFYERESLYVNPQTPMTARLSCGGVVEACLAVARNEVQKTFANVRPPGHHAEPDRPMGFCFFNNVAVAVKVLRQMTPIKRIMILDWDAFNNDPNVLYTRMFYPGGPFGSMESCGVGEGTGYSVNIPWPTNGMRDADYLHAFQKIVMPIATEFGPELVIISAGFDAADGDPLGECHVSPGGYAHMTHMLSGLAGGKLVVALEGGYNVDALSRSALTVGRTLLGEAPPEMGPLVASEIGTETVFLVAKEQSRYWKSIDVRACEPREEGLEEITFTIPELLKAHRQDYMYREFDMLEIPILNEDLRDRFHTQVMCSKDVMENPLLVVFVHEFGNIRAELASSFTCEVQAEHSYMVDASKRLVKWCRNEGYALVDINLYPHVPPPSPPGTHIQTPEEYARRLMVYVWDNYILLSNAKKVILVGHGPGVAGLMELVNHRTAGVMDYVKLVAQVVGYSKVPLLPRNSGELTSWYYHNSLVVIPADHPIRRDNKVVKRHGRTLFSEQEKPIRILLEAFDVLQQEAKAKLSS
ncbi:histone deacetylase complex protein [Amylostereum chailletii]|nr:histone deacetylase complex protein [Amylostereum chailletii]